jgi:cystathionine gamma-synthase/methionine-gamma-lyase
MRRSNKEAEKMATEKKEGDPRRETDPRLTKARLGTMCVHAGDGRIGEEPYPSAVPVYQATTYYFKHASSLEKMLEGERDGYAYSRWGSVTNSALESAISTLVGGGVTIAASSGMAANFAAFQAAGLRRGATLLASREIYGNSYDIIKNHFEKNGARCVFADFKDLSALELTMERERPDVVFFEVLSNPTLSVIDSPKIIAAAHKVGAKVVVDNTFATPYLYRPLLDGTDYETHSLTKYLNGHGDALGGSITCAPSDFRNLETIVCTQGAVLSPDAAKMIARGMKTFVLRMRQHCANAKALADYLSGRKEVERIVFPGLQSHPGHETAIRLFRPGEYGGMLCFDLKGAGKTECFRFIDELRLVTPAGSLGDVKSLIVHPSSTTHHSLSVEEKRQAGISESMVRVSAGIEEPEDLIEDFDRALTAIGR